jgi:hypothetical protein
LFNLHGQVGKGRRPRRRPYPRIRRPCQDANLCRQNLGTAGECPFVVL